MGSVEQLHTETIEAGFLQELLAQGLGYVHLCKYY